jgi:hypothetical protein
MAVLWPTAGAVLSRVVAAGGRMAVPVIAARMAAVLSWARAVRAVCRQIASQVRAWDWSQPRVSFPVLNVSSAGQRRPAMVMK